MSKKNNDLKKHYLDAVNQIDNESKDSYINRYIDVLRDLFTNIGTDRVIIRNNWWINKEVYKEFGLCDYVMYVKYIIYDKETDDFLVCCEDNNIMIPFRKLPFNTISEKLSEIIGCASEITKSVMYDVDIDCSIKVSIPYEESGRISDMKSCLSKNFEKVICSKKNKDRILNSITF